jgi:hypothetical protein
VSPPDTTADAGYVLDAWTWNITVDTITTDGVTVTANFKDASYNLTLPTVSNVTVTTTGGVTGGQVTHNQDVTFTVSVAEGSNQRVGTVSYRIGSADAVALTADDTGVYTISGEVITDGVSILVEAVDTVTVTFQADQNGKLSTTDGGTATSITKVIDKGSTLTDDDIPTPVGDPGYKFDQWDSDPTGTIDADTTYTASFTDASYTISADEGSGISFGNVTPTHGTKLTFTPTATGKIITGVTAKIGEKSIDVTKNNDGSYSIDGDAITGDITITVTTVDGSFELISKTDYAALDNGTQVVVLTATKSSEVTYNLSGGEIFYWSDPYNAYVTIASADSDVAALASQLGTTEGAAQSISYDGDINVSGSTTAADAGIVNDILHGVNLAYTPDTKMRLQLDVTGDKSVTTSDIVWILQKAVGLISTGSGGGGGSTTTTGSADIGGGGSTEVSSNETNDNT